MKTDPADHAEDAGDRAPATATIERVLWRPAEAAVAFGVSRSTIYQLIASGAIPSVRLTSRGVPRIPVEAFKAWIKAQLDAPPEVVHSRGHGRQKKA